MVGVTYPRTMVGVTYPRTMVGRYLPVYTPLGYWWPYYPGYTGYLHTLGIPSVFLLPLMYAHPLRSPVMRALGSSLGESPGWETFPVLKSSMV